MNETTDEDRQTWRGIAATKNLTVEMQSSRREVWQMTNDQ